MISKILILLLSITTSYASESVGTYNDGHLNDSKAIEKNTHGTQSVNPWRKHNYGNTELVSFIKDLGQSSINQNLGQLLIGDLSSKHGGELPGHASHQNGLDVDIWFYRPADTVNNLPDTQRDSVNFPHFLNPRTNTFYPNTWDSRLNKILKMTAEDSRVARIFVNPGVKKLLCSLYPNQDFLKKVRPWFRHHEHFHVRLKCPTNSPDCKNQEPSTSIECSGDDFNWWFSEEFTNEYDSRYGSKKLNQQLMCDH
jgi:penicillin-insensitive murein endopeptidase